MDTDGTKVSWGTCVLAGLATAAVVFLMVYVWTLRVDWADAEQAGPVPICQVER